MAIKWLLPLFTYDFDPLNQCSILKGTVDIWYQDTIVLIQVVDFLSQSVHEMVVGNGIGGVAGGEFWHLGKFCLA